MSPDTRVPNDPMRRIRRFLALPNDEIWAFFEAALLLSVAKFAVAILPFRWIARHLGPFGRPGPYEGDPGDQNLRPRVMRSLGRAARHLPWKTTCLARAIAGYCMLSRRGVRSTLYLGVAKESGSGELSAHAWLRSGDLVLTGGNEDLRRYTIVGSFTSGELP